MGMLRLVRAFTGREKIVKFDGCYHGHADGFLVQAGSGVATLGLPDSPGRRCRGPAQIRRRGEGTLAFPSFFVHLRLEYLV